jgi:hypothetical protein
MIIWMAQDNAVNFHTDFIGIRLMGHPNNHAIRSGNLYIHPIWMAHQSNADEVCMKIDSIVPYMATDMITEGFRI